MSIYSYQTPYNQFVNQIIMTLENNGGCLSGDDILIKSALLDPPVPLGLDYKDNLLQMVNDEYIFKNGYFYCLREYAKEKPV